MLGSLLGRYWEKMVTQETSEFHLIMEMAHQINEINPLGLKELVRALLRPMQVEHLVAVAERGLHRAPVEIRGDHFFFDLWGKAGYQPTWIRPTPEVRLELSRDIVLPTPWHRHRYAEALGTIGGDKKQGGWRQDINHRVSLWLPWGIAFVTGGNHSIAAGILAGEGSVTATEVMDACSVFETIACDGRAYRSTETGRTLAVVRDFRRAAVFEIGRLLADTGPRLLDDH